MIKLKPLLQVSAKLLFGISILTQLTACGGGASNDDTNSPVNVSNVPVTTTNTEQTNQSITSNSDITIDLDTTELNTTTNAEQTVETIGNNPDITTDLDTTDLNIPPVAVNRAPTLSGVPDTSITVGEFYSFQPTAMDIDGDALTFSIENRPKWISFNNSNGSLSGTPMDTDIGSSENIMVTASDGSTSTSLEPFSIRVNNPSSQSEVNPRKYNPGHYIAMMKWKVDDQPVMIDAIKPGVVGFHKRYSWRDLEPNLGQYDFSQIESDLALLAGQGMQLVAMIEDKSFKNEKPTPPYLDAYTLVNRASGYTAKRWAPYVVTRMTALMEALGNHFDAHPNFEGVAIPESSLSLNTDVLTANGYTPEKYRDALTDVLIGAAQGLPNSRVFWYMNYLIQHQGYIADIASAVAPYGVVMGGPDVLPDSLSLNQHTYPLYDQFQGQMPLFCSLQPDSYSHLHTDTSYPGKYWTMDELFRFARDDLHVNYLFWTRQPNPTPADAYDWTDALPVMENNPVFNHQ